MRGTGARLPVALAVAGPAGGLLAGILLAGGLLAGILLAGGLLAGTLPAGSQLAAAAPAAVAATRPGTITTIAGGPGRGPALTVAQDVGSVAVSPAGRVYLGDTRGVVREFSDRSSWETVTAGNATQNLLSAPGADVPATTAALDSVDGLALDAAGNVVISDGFDYLVRVVAARPGTFYGQAMKAGNIYTIAGNGTYGYSGDGGPATSAELAMDRSRGGHGPAADSLRRSLEQRGAGGRGSDGTSGPALKPGTSTPSPGTASAGVQATAARDQGRARLAPAGWPWTGPGTRYIATAVTTGSGGRGAAPVSTTAGRSSRGHLHHRRDWPAPFLRRRRSRRLGRPALPGRADHRPRREPGHRRHRQPPGQGDRARSAAFYGRAMTAGDIYTIGGDGHEPRVGYPQGVAVNPAGNVVLAGRLPGTCPRGQVGQVLPQAVTAATTRSPGTATRSPVTAVKPSTPRYWTPTASRTARGDASSSPHRSRPRSWPWPPPPGPSTAWR